MFLLVPGISIPDIAPTTSKSLAQGSPIKQMGGTIWTQAKCNEYGSLLFLLDCGTEENTQKIFDHIHEGKPLFNTPPIFTIPCTPPATMLVFDVSAEKNKKEEQIDGNMEEKSIAQKTIVPPLKTILNDYYFKKATKYLIASEDCLKKYFDAKEISKEIKESDSEYEILDPEGMVVVLKRPLPELMIDEDEEEFMKEMMEEIEEIGEKEEKQKLDDEENPTEFYGAKIWQNRKTYDACERVTSGYRYNGLHYSKPKTWDIEKKNLEILWLPSEDYRTQPMLSAYGIQNRSEAMAIIAIINAAAKNKKINNPKNDLIFNGNFLIVNREFLNQIYDAPEEVTFKKGLRDKFAKDRKISAKNCFKHWDKRENIHDEHQKFIASKKALAASTMPPPSAPPAAVPLAISATPVMLPVTPDVTATIATIHVDNKNTQTTIPAKKQIQAPSLSPATSTTTPTLGYSLDMLIHHASLVFNTLSPLEKYLITIEPSTTAQPMSSIETQPFPQPLLEAKPGINYLPRLISRIEHLVPTLKNPELTNRLTMNQIQHVIGLSRPLNNFLLKALVEQAHATKGHFNELVIKNNTDLSPDDLQHSKKIADYLVRFVTALYCLHRELATYINTLQTKYQRAIDQQTVPIIQKVNDAATPPATQKKAIRFINTSPQNPLPYSTAFEQLRTENNLLLLKNRLRDLTLIQTNRFAYLQWLIEVATDQQIFSHFSEVFGTSISIPLSAGPNRQIDRTALRVQMTQVLNAPQFTADIEKTYQAILQSQHSLNRNTAVSPPEIQKFAPPAHKRPLMPTQSFPPPSYQHQRPMMPPRSTSLVLFPTHQAVPLSKPPAPVPEAIYTNLEQSLFGSLTPHSKTKPPETIEEFEKWFENIDLNPPNQNLASAAPISKQHEQAPEVSKPQKEEVEKIQNQPNRLSALSALDELEKDWIPQKRRKS